MSVSKMVKANLITQLILTAVAFVIFFFIGLFAARDEKKKKNKDCLLYTSPSPRDS